MLPGRYTSNLAEHHAVRQAAGLFDSSHMGEILVEGPGAGAFLDHALAGVASAVAVGKAKYTMVLAQDGGIIDDLIVYRLQDEQYLVIANAGNREPVARVLTDRVAGFDATVEDQSDDYALIALQGPAAARILAETADVEDLTRPLEQLAVFFFPLRRGSHMRRVFQRCWCFRVRARPCQFCRKMLTWL